jgi:hypothetical protein
MKIFRFIEPDHPLIDGAEEVTDTATITLVRNMYKAQAWAINPLNEGAYYFVAAYLPTIPMPDRRTEMFDMMTQLRVDMRQDYDSNGPTEERTKLVRWPVEMEGGSNA